MSFLKYSDPSSTASTAITTNLSLCSSVKTISFYDQILQLLYTAHTFPLLEMQCTNQCDPAILCILIQDAWDHWCLEYYMYLPTRMLNAQIIFLITKFFFSAKDILCCTF